MLSNDLERDGGGEYQGDEPTPATGSVALGTNIVLAAWSSVVTSKYHKAWMNFSAFPGQVRLTPLLADGQELFGFMQEGCWNGPYRFPDRNADGGAWLTPPPNRGEDLTLTAFVGGEPTATVTSADGRTELKLTATVTSADGRTELKLTATGTPMQIRFVYEPGANDTGVAKVTALSSQVGFMLLVR